MNDFANMMERNAATRKVMQEFSCAAYAKYGSDSYTAGYLESVLVRAIANMSKKDRDMILIDLALSAEKMQKEVEEDARFHIEPDGTVRGEMTRAEARAGRNYAQKYGGII